MDIPRSIDTLRKSGGREVLRQLGRPLAFAVVAVAAVAGLVLIFDPSTLSVPLDKRVDELTDWVTVAWHPLFHAISTGVLWVLVRLERFLIGLPTLEIRDWEIGYAIIAPVAFVAWRTVGWKLAAIAIGGLLFIGNVGLWNETMSTVAVVGTATVIAVGFAVPMGILMARSDRVEVLMRPILDGMQTMPSFVYLVPAIMLFGLGKVPAVFATVIYAVPPAMRLTNLGIRLVDPERIEAAKAFGTTSWQLLLKVQLPLARPTIMAGVNQTIMMALAMVVLASMVGGKGLGAEILNGIARLEVGRGFQAGLAIVILAMVIDRISQAFAKSQRGQASQ